MAAGGILDVRGLEQLVTELRADGFVTIGPTVRDGAVVYDEIDGVVDLPRGVTDEQAPGSYRLRERDDEALFGYAVGPQSWKQFLFPPRTLLFTARRTESGFEVHEPDDESSATAFIGVRGCDLAAMAVQDRVFVEAEYPDAHYEARRSRAFVVAVNCSDPAATCFCGSMGTGPSVGDGFDLALTELLDGDRHEFLVETATDAGAHLLERLPHRPVRESDLDAAAAVARAAEARLEATMNTRGLPQLLEESLDHPRWDDVASRCLSCANCTMVCPTCFCSSVEDTTDLTGDHAERWRRWDSCFGLDHSYLVGGSVRDTTRSRYRQWLTHKLGTWVDQFGVSGCVGCGRCIAWCPVGIDLTEEVRALQGGGD